MNERINKLAELFTEEELDAIDEALREKNWGVRYPDEDILRLQPEFYEAWKMKNRLRMDSREIA